MFCLGLWPPHHLGSLWALDRIREMGWVKGGGAPKRYRKTRELVPTGFYPTQLRSVDVEAFNYLLYRLPNPEVHVAGIFHPFQTCWISSFLDFKWGFVYWWNICFSGEMEHSASLATQRFFRCQNSTNIRWPLPGAFGILFYIHGVLISVQHITVYVQ